MLRRRNVNFKNVKELDAFPKVPEDYTNKSAVGGTCKSNEINIACLISLFKNIKMNLIITVSFITFCLIAWLVILETRYFLNARLFFKFEPDTDVGDKLKINVDITVAMPCSRLGADILDSTNQNLMGFEPLSEEDTWWELSTDQRLHFDALKHMNSYLREEYHAIHELLWKSNQVAFMGEPPKR